MYQSAAGEKVLAEALGVVGFSAEIQFIAQTDRELVNHTWNVLVFPCTSKCVESLHYESEASHIQIDQPVNVRPLYLYGNQLTIL